MKRRTAPSHRSERKPRSRSASARTGHQRRLSRWRKRFPKFSLSRWSEARIVGAVCQAFRDGVDAARSVVAATGTQAVGMQFGRRLQVEGLENRVMLAADLELVSVADAQTDTANASSFLASGNTISDDGRYSVFASQATNLVSGISGLDGDQHIYLYDAVADAITLVSASTTAGQAADGFSSQPVISADGSKVAFRSGASDLVAGFVDNNGGNTDLFLYDVATGVTTLVSEGAVLGQGGDGFSGESRISDDGGKIVFQSGATDLVSGITDGNSTSDIFLHDVATGVTTLVSESSTSGNTADAFSFSPRISGDGSKVAFVSLATDIVAGVTDVNGTDNDVFLYDVGTGVTTLVSESSTAGNTGDDFSDSPQISDDGSLLVFRSRATDLVAGINDNNSDEDVFLYEVATGTTTLISESTNAGNTGDGGSDAPQISGDGSTIVFYGQATDLVSGVTNTNGSANDVFLYDVQSGTKTLVSESTTPGNTANNSSFLAKISNDGTKIVFESSATDLVSGITDVGSLTDLFLYDTLTGSNTLITESTSAGNTASSTSTDGRISGDGSTIVFRSAAEDLVTGFTVTDFLSSLYTYDTASPQVKLITPSQSGPTFLSGDSQSQLTIDEGSVSADGRFTVFTSRATNLVNGITDTNGSDDIFLYDKLTETTTLVSKRNGTTEAGNSSSGEARISADGSTIVFQSQATNLVSGISDANGASLDVFVYDVATGVTSVASLRNGTTQTGSSQSFDGRVSADGGKVVFRSNATNLVSGVSDANGSNEDVFVYDVATGVTTAVSLRNGTNQTGNARSFDSQISGDGSKVVFTSSATNLVGGIADVNGTNLDVFVYDIATGVNSLVSKRNGSNQTGNSTSELPHISADGSKIVFQSRSLNLVGGVSDFNGSNRDVFLHDVASGINSVVSLRNGTNQTGNTTSDDARISADGSTIVFRSFATNLVSGISDGNSTQADVFVHNVATGVNSVASVRDGISQTGNRLSDNARVSADGSKVVFRSQSFNLVGGISDNNGSNFDVFVYDVDAGTTSLVSGPVGGSTTGNNFSDRGEISGDGGTIVFQSRATNLVNDAVVLNTDQVYAFSFNTPPTIADQSFDVAEDDDGTTPFATVAAADAESTVTFELTAESVAGVFSIDENSGELSVLGSLNFEAAPNSYTLTVEVTDDDGLTDDATITINVTDVNEFNVTAPVDNDAADDEVPEDAMVDDLVGITAFAEDQDGSNNTVTYTLQDAGGVAADAGGLFKIDLNSGVVAVAAASLNAETATSHNITVRATSSDGSVSHTLFSIAVLDVNEFDVTAPVDNDGDADEIAEDAMVDDTVGITAAAMDDDQSNNTVTYTLQDAGGAAADAGGLFKIDLNSGVVMVATAALDFETNTSHAITVRATSSDGSVSHTPFTIDVLDVNETASPIVLSNTQLAENEDTTGGFTVGTLSAADPDDADGDPSGNGSDAHSWNVVGGADQAVFSIANGDELVIDDGVLNLTAQSSYEVEVQLTDGPNTPTQTFNISVASLQTLIDQASPGDTIVVNPGTYSSLVLNDDITLDGSLGGVIFTGGSPALTVMNGQVLLQSGITLNQSLDFPTILVESGGDLTLQNVVVNESDSFDQTAVVVESGSALDLSSDDNTLNIDGAGQLLDWQAASDLEIVGNALQQDGASISSNFQIEDEIVHALDVVGTGLVTFVTGELFVTPNTLGVQAGIDEASSGDTISVQDSTYTENINLGANLTLAVAGEIAGTIASSGSSVIEATGDLTLGEASNAVSIAGSLLVGSHTVTLVDTGLSLIGAVTSLDGGMLVAANGLSMSGGDQLIGDGTVDAELTTNSGEIAPGLSSGTLSTGNLDLSGGTFTAEIDGLTAGTDHDQIVVTGTVDVTGATLATSGTITAAIGDRVTLIDNDGADAVVGEFATIANGAVVVVNGQDFRLFYDGGDGNDVQLVRVDAVPATVYVDDDFTGTTIGADPDGAGPAAAFGFDAFDNITDALAAVDAGGTVIVFDGSYSEALTIAKDVSLQADNNGGADVDAGGAFTGVSIAAGFDVDIVGFDFTGFAGTGIDAEGDLLLEQSTITGGFTGLSVDGSTVLASGIVISGASIFGVEVTAAGDFTADTSEFSGNNTAGIIVSDGMADISTSSITGNGRGVIVAAAGAATIFGSDLSGNTGDAVENASATAVDASGNWWGSNVETDVQNASTGLVDFTPFLDSGTDSDSGAVGFAGDFSALNVTILGEQTGASGRIQEGVDLADAPGTVSVNDGTYDETVVVDKSLTLQSLNALGASIAPTSGSQQTVVSIDANNVTINGFTIQVNQGDDGFGAPIAPVGISNIPTAGSNGDFDGLTISNNSITSVGDSPANWSNSPSLSVRGSGVVLHGPTSPTAGIESVELTDNSIDISSGTSFFQRGVWLAELNADITGNTIAGASNDVIFQFASGGASLIDDNDFVGDHRGGGAGLNISDPNAGSPITISNNDFLPSGNDPFSFETSLQINRNVNGNNGSPIDIVGNTFDGHVIGIAAGNADGLTIDNNQFTPGENLVSQPLLDNADFVHIAIDSQNASANGSTAISIEADIKNNMFLSATGSTGTGIGVADNLPGSTFGSIDIGVNGANTYDADLVTGVAVSGGVATITETISDLTTAVRLTGGTANIVNSTLSQNNVGVRMEGSSALTMTGGSVDDNTSNGLLVFGDGSFQSVAIDGTAFNGNATGQPVSSGFGDITLFEFAGPAGTPSTASFENVVITSDNPDYAIQVFGRNGDLPTDSLALNPGSTANVSFDNVDILGTQQRFGMLIQQYADLSGFSFNDVTFDSVAQGGLVVFDAAGSLNLGDTTFHDSYTAGDGVGDGTGFDLATSLNSTNATLATFLDATDTPLDTTVLADNFAIEDRVGHAVDAEATPAVAGFVDWVGAGPFANGVFLTPESFAPPFSLSAQVQRAIDVADVVGSKDTVYIQSGTYSDDAQVVIDNDVTVIGEGKGSTILTPGFDTGSSSAGDVRGWWLVEPGINLDLSESTMDGSGQLVWQAIRHRGTGTIDNVSFENIQFNASGPSYAGTAIAAFGGVGPVDVTNSEFSDIGRIGVLYFGSGTTGTFDANTYTGKGVGDFLDYALDVSAGAVIDVTNNNVSNNLGVASSDGSTSAGFLVTTFFGGGTIANFSGNDISNNTTGIVGGFDGTDSSTITIDGDQVTGNVGDGVSVQGATASLSVLDATITGNGAIGVDVNGSTALIEGTDLTGNLVGIQVSGDALVDAGDASDSDVTGLETGSGATNQSSVGGNTLTGYTGAAGNFAIENLNEVASGNVDVLAEMNDYGSSVTAVIEGVIFDDTDDPARTVVIFSQSPVVPPASLVFVNDDWVGTAIGVDADGAGTNGNAFGTDQFGTISDALAAVLAGGDIIVLNGDYDETFVIDKSVSLSTDADPDNLPQTEVMLTASTGTNDKVIIEVASDDVSIDGFHLLVDRDHASGGIAASNVAQPDVNLGGGSFNNLMLTNNVIESTGENIGSFDLVGGLSASAMGIALIGNGGPVHSVTVTGNQVLGTVGTASMIPANPTGFSGFTRGLYLGQVQATATGNTLQGFAQDLHNQFASGGATSITGNTFQLAGVDISSPNAASPIDLSGNLFDIQSELFPQSLLIRAHHDASSTVTVSGNTFTGHTTGVALDNSSAVVIDDNDFTAAAAAVNAVNIVIDTDRFGTLSNTVPVGGTITNNEFFGAGAGIVLRDSNPGSASSPIFDNVVIGTDGNENTFNASLDTFIALDPDGVGGPVDFDLDASENIFGVTSGDLEPSAMSLDDLFELEDKILHTIDVGTLGLVTVVPGQLYVTTNSFDGVNTLTPSIQRGIDAASAGDTVNVSSGTFVENLLITKDVDVIGATDVGGDADTTLQAAAGGDLVQVSGSGFGDDESVLLQNFNFDGLNGLAGYGVRVPSTADFVGLTIDNGDFTGFNFNGVGVFGDSVTGLSVQDVTLSNLSFSDNGISGGGGSGDVQFFLYNGDASLSNLELVGNRNEGAGSGARLGVQFRGVGDGDGINEMPMGTVSLNDIDVSGLYRTQMIGIQRYSDVDSLTFNNVALGGVGSEITGSFGASLRFDAVGSGSVALPATFDLGNTEFRGLDVTSAQVHELEFAPDNSFAFLRVDGTGTTWSGISAAALTLSEAFDVEDRILHFVDKLNPVHGVTFGEYKGFVDIQTDQAFITDRPNVVGSVIGDGSIQRGIDIVDAGGTVNVSSGTFAEGSQIVVDKEVDVIGQGKGITTLMPGFDTSASGDGRGWWLVESTGDLDISQMTFDGTGNLVFQAFRHKGVGSFDDVSFENIQFNASGPNYAGTAIAAFGGVGPVDVSNSMFSDIGRVGVLYFDAGTTGTFDGNMYTGKGVGDFLDYALDISAGAVVDVTNNDISNNLGVASVDGSTSAGVLVSTFFGAGTIANLSGNTISGNSTGVFVGFNNSDMSDVTIDGDTITGNTGSGVFVIGGNATIQNDTNLSGNATGITVGDSGTATIIDNDDTISGNTVGIDVDGGTALVENNDLNGNTIGVLVQNGGVADLGDTSGSDITGLGTGTGLNGSSAGLNDFSGYTVAATSASGAVVVLNNDGGLVGPQGIGAGDIPAFGNTWDDPSAAGIENVIWHDADDNNLAFVDFAGLANLQFTLDQDPVDEGETGDALTLDGSFTNDPQAHTVTIDWGDGTANTVLNLAQGVFTFSADHTYADNDAYAVTITVEEDATSQQISDTITANVDNVLPTLTVVGNQTIDEGSLLSLPDLGMITDPGFDTETFTYFIDWGDSTTPDTGSATIDQNGSVGFDTEASFDGSHTYADNNVFTVTVRVADDDMTADFTTGTDGVDFVEQSFQVTVDNVLPTLTVVGNQTINEGSLLSLPDLGMITDPGFDTETFTYFIDWGDSTTPDTGSATIDQNGSVGFDTEASFDGSHTYADDDVFTVTVRVADDDMTADFTTGTDGVDFVEQSFQVTVDNVLPTLTVVGNQTIDEGSLLSLPDLGMITDPGFDTETFTYFIDWGDSTTPDTGSATIDQNGSVGFDTEASFDGSHTYADNNVFTVTVRVADDDMTADFTTGTDGVDFVEQSFQVTVDNVAPSIAVSAVSSSTDEGSLFTLDLGLVTEPGDDTITQFIIEWGDGDSDIVAGDPENTSHNHTYDDGTQIEEVRITLIDEDGVHTEAGVPNPFNVTVDNVDPTATFFNTGDVDEGTSGTVGFTAQFDPSNADTTAGFRYAFDFDNDGTFDSGDGTYAGSGTASATSVPASFLADGGPGVSQTVRGRIIDKDDGYTDFTTDIGINNLVPTFDAGANATVAVNSLFTRMLMFTDPGSETIAPAGWIITVNYGDGSGDQSPASFNPVTKEFELEHTYTSTGIFTVTVEVDDQDGVIASDTFDVDVFLPTFQVANFTPFASGFDVQFNRAADLLPINLYDGNDISVDAADVIVTTGGNPVDGSITWDAATDTLSFVQTGGVLADGTYDVTLRSGDDAFQDTLGDDLDGDGNGTPGDDFSTSFVVSSAGERVVWIPDFARGAGQEVNVPPIATGGLDLPISIDDATGVMAVDVDVVYDPALLDISGASLGDGPTTAGGWSITTNFVSPGLLKITISGTAALSGTDVELITLDADVPGGAPYADNQVIRLENLEVNEAAIAAKADFAVHKAAYLGDADGDGQYLGNDAALISRVVVDLDSGFDAHDWTDPVIVADSTSNGALSGQDASNVAQEAALIDVPEIPAIPALGPLAANTPGLDPELSLPEVFAAPGDTVTIPVTIEVLPAESVDPTVLSATFDVFFDDGSLALTPAEIAQGSFWNSGDGWSLTKNVLGGQARLVFFNSAPSPMGTGDIALLSYTLDNGLTPGDVVSLDIEPVDPNEGTLTWTNVDGSIAVTFTADFEPDGDVDGDDLALWQAGYGISSGAAVQDGDADRDGNVDGQDFLSWQRQFGSSLAPITAPVAALSVPSTSFEAASITSQLAEAVAQPSESPAPVSTFESSNAWIASISSANPALPSTSINDSELDTIDESFHSFAEGEAAVPFDDLSDSTESSSEEPSAFADFENDENEGDAEQFQAAIDEALELWS